MMTEFLGDMKFLMSPVVLMLKLIRVVSCLQHNDYKEITTFLISCSLSLFFSFFFFSFHYILNRSKGVFLDCHFCLNFFLSSPLQPFSHYKLIVATELRCNGAAAVYEYILSDR